MFITDDSGQLSVYMHTFIFRDILQFHYVVLRVFSYMYSYEVAMTDALCYCAQAVHTIRYNIHSATNTR